MKTFLPSIASNQEWIEADGRGGFASGTVTGIRTRRYHALLLTAITPPTGRIVLVNGFEAWIETPRGRFALTSQRYAPDVIVPTAPNALKRFPSNPGQRGSSNSRTARKSFRNSSSPAKPRSRR